MLKNVVTAFVLCVFIFTDAISQQNTRFYDSLIVSFLRSKQFGEHVGVKRDTINGKVITGKNYYCYESFKLKMKDTATIFVVNFGTYDSEGEKYIAIFDKLISDKGYLFLGSNEFEDDLEQLSTYFKRRGRQLKEKYKIEITDLYLRCKRGQIETPKYIH